MNKRSPLFTIDTPAVPWTIRDVSYGLAAFVVWILTIVLLTSLSNSWGLLVDPSIIVVFGTAFLLVPVWYFTIYKYGAAWADLGFRGFQPASIGLGCGLMLLSLLFNAVYGLFLGLFGLQIQPDIGVMFDSTGFPIFLLVGGAIVAPMVEEVFFRGFVFAGLRTRWRWPVAAMFSAGLFALAHVLPTSLLPIFILGCIFAFLYHVSGSIWPAIFMHSLTNTVALLAAYAISQGWITVP